MKKNCGNKLIKHVFYPTVKQYICYFLRRFINVRIEFTLFTHFVLKFQSDAMQSDIFKRDENYDDSSLLIPCE